MSLRRVFHLFVIQVADDTFHDPLRHPVGLLGEELAGTAVVVARVAGLALVGLGIACWPGTPRVGMLTYSAGATLYLAYLGVAGGATGVLLWPAVAVHAVLTVLLALPSRPR